MVNVNLQTTISPYTQQPVCTRPLLSETELDTVIAEALKAQKSWKKVALDERIAVAEKWLVSPLLKVLHRISTYSEPGDRSSSRRCQI